jgi:ABC-2 type transport system permease protein
VSAATAATAPLRRRPPGDLRQAIVQTGFEARAYWRNPAAAIFTFALPLAFLFIFAGSIGSSKVPGLHGVSFEQYYVPSILSYGLIAACFSNLAVTMVFRRDQGILKRVRGTPIPSWSYFGGAILNSTIVSFLLAAVTITAGVVLFNVPVPHQVLPIVVDLVVGALSFCALGLAVTVVIPNADAAPPMINIVMLVLLFISGTFFYVKPNSGLARVANIFPIAHLVRALLAAIVPQPGVPVWQWRNLLVVAVWGAAGLVVAVRRFRWESTRS